MLSAARIDVFERVNGVVLPAAYRAFLERVGDGGVGPGSGLCALSPWRSVELPGNLPEVEIDGRVCRGVRVSESGGTEATVLLVTGPRSGRLVATREGAPPVVLSADDFLAWYAEWLASAKGVVTTPRSEAELIDVLSAGDESARVRAVHELGALTALSAEGTRLVESLASTDRSSRVRYQAVELLGERDAASVGVLLEAVRDARRSISRRALLHVMRVAGATSAWAAAVDVMRSGTDPVGVRMAEDLDRLRGVGEVLPDGGSPGSDH
ncbi:hypothetical protein [Actinosynnema sp. NPDC020468]|uniref:hypothetical protein n=1 Tax=Actinosynnema sp. NPDC020468 TaxID=3154488 RepID=UPI0033FB9713